MTRALRALGFSGNASCWHPPGKVSLGQCSGMSLETWFSVLPHYVGRGPQSRVWGLNLNLAISVLPVPSGWIFHSAYLSPLVLSPLVPALCLVILNTIHRPSGEYDPLPT